MHRRILTVIVAGICLVVFPSCYGLKEKRENQKKTAESYYRLGVKHLNDGDYSNALVELRKAAEIQPSNPEVHNAMGLVYFYTERNEDAVYEYKKAISLDKKYSEAFVNLGTLYAQQEKFEEARSLLQDYMKIRDRVSPGEDGALAVNGRKLLSIIRELPDDDVIIHSDEHNRLTVRSYTLR